MRALLLSLMVVAACRGPEREAPRPAEPAREETPVVELTAEGMTNAEVRTAMRRIVEEFAASVRAGRPHELDIHRGLHLQRLIDRAAAQL